MNNNNAKYIQEDEIDLRELWNTLVKKKVLIIILTSIITIFGVIFAYSKTPIYEVKSNVQIGFIGKNLIADSGTLIKVANLVFNVEDKITTKEKFVSEVTSISINKKLENFIEIKTQATSNEEAIKKNKEVVLYLEDEYKNVIKQFVLNNKNSIKEVERQIDNLDNLESKNLQRQMKLIKTQEIIKIEEKIKRLKTQDIKNLQRQIELIKTQEIIKIDEKINFYKKIKLITLKEKIKFHTNKLTEYTKSVNQIYKNNKNNNNTTLLAISSIQMVNYQNLILNSQNNVEDLKVQLETIKSETIPNLERDKKNIETVTLKDLELKIDNIKNISITNLQRQKMNIQNDLLRKLEYKFKIELPNKKVRLNEEINKYKFQNSEQNIQNTKIIGRYISKNNPIKPKKKLIVIVTFVTGLILSIFLVFFLEFIGKKEEKTT